MTRETNSPRDHPEGERVIKSDFYSIRYLGNGTADVYLFPEGRVYDIGDGKGERDYVYVARYHCASDYKSKTNSAPMVSITRATARSGIQALGTGYYMFDFAMWWTINMLYLVEFADWDCQKVIGYGRGNGSGVQNTGNSDGMTYHTGTKQSSRTTYGVGVQYRYIEDLWADVYDWMDGIRFSSRKVYAYIKPSEYGNCESSGGTQAFSTSSDLSGCISDYNVPSVSGLEWALFPSKITGSDYTVYVADYLGYFGSIYVPASLVDAFKSAQNWSYYSSRITAYVEPSE